MTTPTRADRLTARKRAPDSISDFDASLSLNPVTGDVSRLRNEGAVSQAIQLTLLTMSGEWPFEPTNGTAVPASLFEPSDPVSLSVLRDTIERAARDKCSAYAVLNGVQVSPRADSRFIDVTVHFSLTADPSVTSSVRVVLKRAR